MVSKARMAIEWDVYRPRRWGQPASHRALDRPWYGLDTERDAETGEFVCCWIAGPDKRQVDKLFEMPPGTYWVYNLAYDLEGMLRDLREDNAWAAKEDGAPFALMDGIACYFHGKRFDYRDGDGNKWTFIEASSFNGRRPLHTLGEKGGEDWDIDASIMNKKAYDKNVDYPRQRPVVDEYGSRTGEWELTGDWGKYGDDVDYYCWMDAKIVYDFAEKLADGLREIGVEVGSTPGATARRFLGQLGESYPRVIWKTHKPFLRSYCGGRFEVCKRGVLHDVKQYDLVSAYPWALSECPWLTETAYHRQTRRYNENALYGSYLVRFEMDDYLGVAPQWRKGIRVYSTKENQAWITKPELEYLHDQGADYRVLRGCEIYDENATELWKNVIMELFDMKQSGNFGWGPKIILNSQYGILIQLVRKSGKWVKIGTAKNPIDFAGLLELEAPPEAFEGGKYYAPVYAGHLTAMTRVRILEAANDCGAEDYIGGHTDSVLTTGKLREGIGDGLGDWQLEKEAERAEICKTGMYAIGDTVKVRGITREGDASMLWQDEMLRKTRIGIKSAKHWKDVSRIVPKYVANNFAVENKRKWEAPVTRGLIAMNRHVDSEPLKMVSA